MLGFSFGLRVGLGFQILMGTTRIIKIMKIIKIIKIQGLSMQILMGTTLCTEGFIGSSH